MRERQLGSTGLRVSELGFGAWGIGKTAWLGADDKTSVAALKTARDEGVTFFDTALAYGAGHSERLLARTFGTSSEVAIASKAPPKNGIWPARRGSSIKEVYPSDHVFQYLDTTLTNLRRETVDLYQFHVWSDEWADAAEWQEAVHQMRSSGKVRFIGISINDHEPENVIQTLKTGLVDVVQVIYNVFEQAPEHRLFPFCRHRHIGVIARVPFDEGGLTGRVRPETLFPLGDFRNRYFAGRRKREVWERVQRIALDAEIPIAELPALALRFCISHPAVSTVIPGMRTPDHVRRNVAAAASGGLPPDLITVLRRHAWKRNFYSNPTSGARDVFKTMKNLPAWWSSRFQSAETARLNSERWL